MAHFLPICVYCFPVAGTPVLPCPDHEWKPDSKCGWHTVFHLVALQWDWGMCVWWPLRCPSPGKPRNRPPSSRRAGRAECPSFALLSFCSSDAHNLRATSSAALHLPVGNFSVSAGSHSWDIALFVRAAAVLERITTWLGDFSSWFYRKLPHRFLEAATFFPSGHFWFVFTCSFEKPVWQCLPRKAFV